MAEIRVEKEKRSLGWLWALLALLLLALLAWWFLTQRPTGPAPADTIAPIDTVAPVDTVVPGDTLVPRDTIGAMLYFPDRGPQLAHSATFTGGAHGTI